MATEVGQTLFDKCFRKFGSDLEMKQLSLTKELVNLSAGTIHRWNVGTVTVGDIEVPYYVKVGKSSKTFTSDLRRIFSLKSLFHHMLK